MSTTEMHRQSAGSPPIAGANAPQPITTLRGWLDHLAAHDRLAVIQSGTRLQFELAAIAKRFDGIKATLFPHPGGHSIPVISGLVSDRTWIAEAMGVEPAERSRALSGCRAQSAAVEGGQERSGAGGRASRCRSYKTTADAGSQRARQRRLYHRRTSDRAQSGDRYPECLDPSPAGLRARSARRAAVAAPYAHVLRGRGGGGTTARCCDRGRCRSADAVVVAGDRADRFRRTHHCRRAARRAACRW